LKIRSREIPWRNCPPQLSMPQLALRMKKDSRVCVE
jgi:hypothetical protein